MEQLYQNYTEEDRTVWRTLFDRQMKNLEKVVSQTYLDAIEVVNFRNDKIPDFKEVDEILGKTTGWGMHAVPCISEQREFFELLSKKRFTATTWLRKMSQLDYLEEPDMFHDVFGHVPLLSNAAYTGFFQGISEIAMKHLNDPKAIELLGRIYWFTIEFGLIRENDKLKIYGAGVISSSGETEYCQKSETKWIDFDVKQILASPFSTDKIQDKYFVIESFDQLFNSLPLIETELNTLLIGMRA
ncbi:MAG: phenylalanine 4-monooxygenase [Bacteroidetes bacterium]|nr:MAG: phenylalanine 4-monooxygenase [Bacteroidota bacterium]